MRSVIKNMEKKDHKRLAEFWMKEAGGDLPRSYQLAFIIGNIEPDINGLTYLHGFRTQQKFHGHHYENVMPILLKKLKRDMGRPLTLLRCYRIGKCFHYAADCFTFPHNKEFTGTMKEHMQYEKELHEYWLRKLYNLSAPVFPRRTDPAKLTAELKRLHDEYTEQPHDVGHDYRYILSVTQLLLETYLLPERKDIIIGSVVHARLIQPRY